jgi:hypothetical protein
MRNRPSLTLTVAIVILAGAGLLMPAGCEKKKAAPAKPTTTMAAGEVVNGHCPILGSKLDRANVPAELTRMFQGKKVGFCCAGCPDQWDQLTDAQKTAKLAAAMK